MKLRLPTLLCTALLACMAALPSAYAANYTAKGVDVTGFNYSYDAEAYVATFADSTNRFYDGGKGTYWDGYNSVVRAGAAELFAANGNSFSFLGDLQTRIPASSGSSCTASSFQNLADDGGLCWAYTSSNVLQYWQTYYGVFAKKAGDTSKTAPIHGYTYDKDNLSKLGGTQSLKLNMEFYDHWVNNGGSSEAGLSWYLGGMSSSYLQNPSSASGGYFKEYFPNATQNTDYSTCLWADTNLENFSRDLKTLFGQDDGTKGQIVHLDLFSSGYTGHAVTCYGYETDDDGIITAVYVANSDDQAYGLIKLTVKWEAMNNGTGAVLYNGAYRWTYAGKDWRITSMNAIDTPEVLKDMLAEYEKGKMTWMGNLESWTGTSDVVDVNVLPTDETGWMTYAGSNTQHAGYYNTYYDINRGVVFNDEATNGNVTVAENITTPSMEVNNTNLAYTFDGGGTAKTLTVNEFSKKGSGKVTFDNVKLVAGTVTTTNDVTFDELHVTGTLNAAGNRIYANDLTLDGDASIGSLGADSSESGIGTTNLTINGGKTTINNWWAWSGLKSLTMSDKAQLEVGASLRISGNISSTADLSQGGTAGITTLYCLNVGTDGDASTGHVDLAGNITAGAHIKIRGNANVTGNVTTTKDYIEIDGVADIGGNLNAGSGTITLGKGGDVDGTLTGSTITLKDSTTMGRIADDANLVVSGGTATVEYSAAWTNLGNLTLSDQARLEVAASVKVAGNITGADATATLASGSKAGINARYCIEVGTLENGILKAGTGDATMTGDLTAQAYIKIHGNADITGNITSSGDGGDRSVSVGGNANVSGDIKADHGVTIGGNLTMATNKTLTAQSLSVGGALKGAGSESTKTSLTTTEGMTLSGDVSNVSLTAKDITIGTVGSAHALDSVDISLTGGELTLNNVTVTGNSTFTPAEGQTQLTLNATNVTFVLDGSNSYSLDAQFQPFALISEDELVATTTAPKTFVINSGMLENLNVNGSVTLDLSHWQDAIEAGGYENVTLAFADDMSYRQGSTVQATFNGSDFVAADATADNTATFSVSKLSGGDAVPEPTTATLSLLALAALAARRRRK